MVNDNAVGVLVELFHGELAELRFPSVDVSTLDAAVERVQAQSMEVERLRASLNEAVETLHTEQRELLDHARQGHAYARVYATGNAELTGKLDEIVLDAPTPTAPKKRRARRTKAAVAAPQLVLENETPAVEEKDSDKTVAA